MKEAREINYKASMLNLIFSKISLACLLTIPFTTPAPSLKIPVRVNSKEIWSSVALFTSIKSRSALIGNILLIVLANMDTSGINDGDASIINVTGK